MDIYAEVTSRIIDQLEQGCIPWAKPWIASGNAISRATGKPYSLLNQMILGKPGEYVTFKQCQQEGGKVRKGEKASMVVFWKFIEQEDEETHEKKQVPLLRYFPCSTSISAKASSPSIHSSSSRQPNQIRWLMRS